MLHALLLFKRLTAFPAVVRDGLRRLVRYEASDDQIEAVHRVTPYASFGNLMCGSVFLFACCGDLPTTPFLCWYALLVATCVGIYLHHLHVSGSSGGARSWAFARLMIWAAAFAAPWSMLSFCALGALPHIPELLLFSCVAAMTSNGAIYRAPLPPAAALYVVLMLAPIIAKCLLLEDTGYLYLAAMSVAFTGFLSLIIVTAARHWRERSEVHTLNADLVAGFPGGMAMLDATGRVLLMNDRSHAVLRISPESEQAARENLLAYLASPAAPKLIDEASEAELKTFFEAVHTRTECLAQIEYADHTAMAFVGQPAEGGRYLVVFKDITVTYQEGKRLEHTALRDPLTQVYNRVGLQQHLDAARAERKAFAVLAIDLDKFKNANDTYGHIAGDEVLKAVAARIKQSVRGNDCVARLGGDEFIVVLRNNPDSAEFVADRIQAAIIQPVSFEGYEIEVGASIGVAYAGREDETNEDLIRRADDALYRSKRARKFGDSRSAA